MSVGRGVLRRVLVVDDHAVNRELAIAFAEELGWLTVAVEDGRGALGAVQSQDFDAILLDINMPGMSGLEVLGALRAEVATRDLWVIAYTAHALPDEVGGLIERGFDAVLVKPISMERIASELARAAGR